MNKFEISFKKDDGAEKFLEFFRKIKEETKAITHLECKVLYSDFKEVSPCCEVEFHSRQHMQGEKMRFLLNYEALSPLRVILPGEVFLAPDLLVVKDVKPCHEEKYYRVIMTFCKEIEGEEVEMKPIAEMLLCEYVEGMDFEEDEE